MAIVHHRSQDFESRFLACRGEGVEAKPEGAFAIEVRFLAGLSQRQQDAFASAAMRWTEVITGELPSVVVDGELVDDVLILAEGADIDGPGRILGQAGPTALRPAAAGPAAAIPAKGRMIFDSADLSQLKEVGTLDDVIAHEMGHVLGVGTIWEQKSLLVGARTDNPVFVGPAARMEFGKLLGEEPTDVPVENRGGPGTADSHWREDLFRDELMSGFISAAPNPLSRLTAASLQDLGYTVDLGAAEPYELPSLMASVQSAIDARRSGVDMHRMMPILPTMLPDSSMTPD
ncbi:leishmanolysin-related zinc metalloendopeptidase [Erythrobacter sp. THAF29]|uniref:leishmanolysin-related zinc metalloendopeptidase n=1 Tax=Erythrobacter sp. THAF29 TaxID=2587851 RepID=UPI0012692909|nr:leishmanolysin-related zinc metalloendopeptidase [Erythrobacter sp. THAF29]QFT78772.1 Leishmanolysin [Erythrobacter sp. THAF29]